MKFFSEEVKIQELLKTEHLVIRPLLESDVELDFKAVIANREVLLKGSNGRWPDDKFDIEKNREDLIYHESMHKKGEEFTFTIMNSNESECVGCLYMVPLKESLKQFVQEADPIVNGLDNFAVQVRFWLIPQAINENIHKEFLLALIPWLKNEWSFSTIVFTYRPFNTEVYDAEILKEHFENFYEHKTGDRIQRFLLLK